MKKIITYSFLVLCFFIQACSRPSFTKTDHQIIMHRDGGTLAMQVISNNIIHIIYAPGDSIPAKKELAVIAKPESVHWSVKEENGIVMLKTDSLTAKIDTSGRISYYDSSGRLLISEKVNGRKMPIVKDQGKSTYAPEQTFNVGDEALYGLGQYQNGLINWKDVPLRFRQFNQQDAVPFLVSTKGYGLLWDNYSVTKFNPPSHQLHFQNVIDSARNIRTTSFTPKKSGTYHFAMECKTKKGNRFSGPVVLTINKDTVIYYNTTWVPEYLTGKATMQAGKHYFVRFQNTNAQTPGRIFYNSPEYNKTEFKSNFGNRLDYYMVYGKTPGQVIKGYRKLTGAAPMFGKWAYGFWQCRERYHTQHELLENATQYRKRHLPVDNIVQDWNYWPKGTWGPQWDRNRYPNPGKMVDSLKDMHFHLMVSVWPRLDNPALEKRYHLTTSHMIDTTSGNLDLWNPQVRKDYYKMIRDSMFSFGVSSIWLDASEPENHGPHAHTFLGPFNQYALTYPLEVTKAVYNGHRKDYPNQRVFNLTRSAFAGMQRYGAAYWTGDINATWHRFRAQIPGGLNFSMAGLPYWTTDIGGFFREKKSLNPVYKDQYTSSAYKELLTRWFEFGAFCPIFRIHGYKSETEVWRYGKTFEQTARKYLNLRYQLMPYIYTLASKVTLDGTIMMRPLAFAYPHDKNTWNIPDQFLFGSSILVNPVTHRNARSRNIYLPKGNWFNFWTDKEISGGKKLNVHAPLDEIPLFVKAGSIIPVGPKVQYASQPTNKPIRLFLYPGANTTYKLYEDDGETYRYEQGKYSQIPMNWNDQKKRLTMGDRIGSFKGMKSVRKFEIVLVKPGKVHGLHSQKVDTTITYNGKEQVISLN